MRLGVFGGSFDPVHRGHLALARAALKQQQLSRVIFVLSPQSPFKQQQRLSPVRHRLAMLKAAVRGQRGFVIGRYEIHAKGPSYTINTLKKIRRDYPHDDLFLILGSDAWNGFPQWRRPAGVMALATALVGKRPGVAPKIFRPYQNVKILKGRFPAISSTLIRKSMSKSMKNNTVLPAAVARYVRRHKLYGAGSR